MASQPSSSHPIPPDLNPSLPSSSSVETKYDVFISFRGSDVRFTFLSHLLEALSLKKIKYFVDDQNLKPGDKISSTLRNAIKKSEISLVLFSEDYASSKWCLEELEQIIQCVENQKQIILPIFYKVDPSTVRYQKEKYEEAFHRHGERSDDDKLQKWKAALKKASDISGFDSSKYKTEAMLIKELVEHVWTMLKQTGELNDRKDLVGIHEHIKYLEARLDTRSQNIFIIGIWGMGGVGKTTIAEILYEKLCDKYDAKVFFRVKEELNKHGNKVQLKRDLLSKLLSEDKLDNVILHGIPPWAATMIGRKKVLLVLDDISESNELELLTGGHTWFGSGSRIIMTSRDKHLFSSECDEIYLVKPLNFEDAFQLFENTLTEKCYVQKQERYELSKKVLNYTQGVPLAIRVIGRYLWDKNKEEWQSKVEKLEKMLDSNIQIVLELSYNGMGDDQHKDIFLYLACFFRNESKERIIMLLDACGYHTIDGLRALQDKALITISNTGFVSMHELIQAMGCEIIRKRSLEDFSPCSHLRDHLWGVDDIYNIFKNQLGTRSTIKSIHLDISRLNENLQLGPQAFDGMDNLRLLQFDNMSENKYKVYPCEQGFKSLPNELRCFIWTGYPSKSFPSRFCKENLVELRFKYSKLQRLWSRPQEFPNLKIFDLSWSEDLIEPPYLSKAPKLDGLLLLYCEKLTHLNLCQTSLSINPSSKYYVFPSLKKLQLNGCKSLTEVPENIGFCFPSLQELLLLRTDVVTLPKSIKHLSKLTTLYLLDCFRLWYIPELPPFIEMFEARNCTSLEELQFTSKSIPLSQQNHKLIIQLIGCEKLSYHVLEAVARHYELATQEIISASIKRAHTSLSIPRNAVPMCFCSRYSATQNLVSVPLRLPLHLKGMGFIFYFVILKGSSKVPPNRAPIRCHIELSNAPEVQFTYYPINQNLWGHNTDRVIFWYESKLSEMIMEEVSRIKQSTTMDDLSANVWFQLDLKNIRNWLIMKEWGVYPIFISSEPHDSNDNNDELQEAESDHHPFLSERASHPLNIVLLQHVLEVGLPERSWQSVLERRRTIKKIVPLVIVFMVSAMVGFFIRWIILRLS